MITKASATVSGGDAGLLDRILERMRQGVAPDPDELAAEHPEHASEIRQLVAVIRFVHEAADRVDPLADLDARLHLARRKPVLGDFQIVREIDRGGMGVVYEALQQSLGRRVALKVLLPGVTVSERAMARFNREAQTAGGLHHSHIVPIYAVGRQDGIVYYAMQYIEGQTLAQRLKALHAAGFEPDVVYFRQVAEWARQIAEALAHAHEHGVIHRDIKPANVMLDADDKVWVTDFGLARDDAHLTLTLSGDIVGTARYMSPEQARGSTPLDERTDVYSLGVTLYELACLHAPFTGLDRESTLKQVLLDEPIPLRRRNRRIPAALETIVHKALEKEPSRRYASAAMMADDLRRYLNDQPLLARPPSGFEQLMRLVSRHKAVSAALAAVFTLLAGFTITALIQAAQISREQDKTHRVNEFLQTMLASADPANAGPQLTVADLLEQAAARIDTELVNEPEIAATIRDTIGRTYIGLGRYDQAEHQLRLALAARQTLLGPEHPDVAVTLRHLADLFATKTEFEKAEPFVQEALQMQRRLLSPDDPDLAETIETAAWILDARCDFAAEELFREVLAIRIKNAGADHASIATARRGLSSVLLKRGALDSAEQELRAALSIWRARPGPEHIEQAEVLNRLGILLDHKGEHAAAEPLYHEALDIYRQRLPDHNADSATVLTNLGMCLRLQGDYSAAQRYLHESLEIDRRLLGDEHETVVRNMIQLAETYRGGQQWSEAASLYDQSLAILRKGNENALLFEQALLGLADSTLRGGDPAAAEPLFRECWHFRVQRSGEGHPLAARNAAALGRCLTALARFEEAESLLAPSYDILLEQRGPSHRQTRDALDGLITLYEEWNKPALATKYLAARESVP